VEYVVNTPTFEGPLELLVHLVNTHELDVVDLPLAPIVDAFVARLSDQRESLSMDLLSEFLLFASILVELKSQRLLPGPDDATEDEELDGWEQRDLLLGRLLECQAYGALAHEFAHMAELAARSIPREAGLDAGFEVHAPDLLAGVTPQRLAEVFVRVSAARPVPVVDLSHVTVDSLSVHEAVGGLVERLPGEGAITFRTLTSHLQTRLEVIVHFLAVLELCKLGRIELGQGRTFGDLEISWIAAERAFATIGTGAVDDYEG
jgi:segregation and condensation protein A